MTKTNLLLLFFVILLGGYSCYQIVHPKEENVATTTKSPVSYRSDVNFEDVTDAFYKGTIGLLNNSTILSIIEDRTSSEDTDERISYAFLKEEADKENIDLVALMKTSIDANGGTSAQKLLIEDVIDGFSENSNVVLPMIYLPYTENFSTLSTINIVKGEKVMPTGTWSGKKFVNGSYNSITTLSQTVAENTPLLIITTGKGEIDDYPTMGLSSGSGGWLPWRRCYCSEPLKSEDGSGTSSQGRCNKHRGDSNRCLYVCDRTGFNGACDNEFCGSCF